MQDTHDVQLVGLSLRRKGFMSGAGSPMPRGVSDPQPTSPGFGCGALLIGLTMLGVQYPLPAVAAPGVAQPAGTRGAGGPTLLAEIAAFALIVLAAALVVILLRRRFAREIAVQREAALALEASTDEARAIIDTAYDAFIEIDSEGTIVQWNRAAESTFGWHREEALGARMAELILPERHRAAHRRQIEDFGTSDNGAVPARKREMEALHRDGHEFPIELSIWRNRAGDNDKFNVVLHDISEHRRVARRQAAQGGASAALVASATVAEAAPKLLDAVCTALDWAVGALWTVDRSTDTLQCVEYWHQRDTRRPTFEAITWATKLVRGRGLPGRVWESGKPAWVPDVTLDPNFPRASFAAADGLHGAFAFPIFRGDVILGVAEFFSAAIEAPDSDLLKMMDTLGNLMGQFMARIEAEAELEQEGEFQRALLDNISEGIVACDAQGVLTLFNRATREFHGLPEQPLPAEAWAEHYSLFHADGTTPMAAEEIPLRRAFQGERISNVEMVIAPRGRERRTLVCNGQALVTPTGRKLGAVVALHDITARKDAEQTLNQLAHLDPLTGLPNRRSFLQSLQAALSQADAQGWIVAVLFVDLDRFKAVNDTLGHEVGDELLRQVGSRLVQALRIRDIVGRLGGDEFAVILVAPHDPAAAATAAEKLFRAFDAPFVLGGRELSMTSSIGISIYPNDASNLTTLLKYADAAMYEAKATGRGGYRFYTSELNSRVLEKADLESALSRALDRDEFVLHYQPRIDIASGRWLGVEALLRWNRPGHGLVLPQGFLASLEETGLIAPVGAWVLGAACRQIREWQHAGIPLGIAVNISARQFEPAGHAHGEQVAESADPVAADPLWLAASSCIRAHEIPPGLLQFDLTENTLAAQPEKSVVLLRRLQALGIGISVDDFGTGYSRLGDLQRFRPEALKIDGRFIHEMTISQDQAAVVLAIIDMARHLNLKVVAEGVETGEQLDFLRRHGCDQAQGNLIARAIPVAALERAWREHGGRYPWANVLTP